jgi:hypothetical protein
MKSNLIFLTILLLASSNVNAAPDVKAFIDGDRTAFSTLNHKKSKGLNMEFAYPKGWVAKEGEKPNIVQKFVSESGMEMVAITVKTLPTPAGTKVTEEEMKEFFTEDALREMVPDGAKVFMAKPTKVEGLPAGMIEYSVKAERLGVVVETHAINFMFIYGSNLVSVSFSVMGMPDSKIKVEDRVKELRPIFLAMANRILLPDKWK